MAANRRDFLKAAGVAVIGVGGGSVPLLARAAKSGGHGHDAVAEAARTKRYALVVDTTKCKAKDGCTACTKACHSTHNVPSIDDTEEEIKWIWKDQLHYVFEEKMHERTGHDLAHRPVMVLCNHCDNPPCVRVCPTQATFRRESDGIIMMDQHRCIGCRYCVVACPYGARSFNWSNPRDRIAKINPGYPTRTKGVVEKCTFCAARLARNLQPACVDACQKVAPGTMVFGDLNDTKSEVYGIVHHKLLARRKPILGTRPQVYYVL